MTPAPLQQPVPYRPRPNYRPPANDPTPPPPAAPARRAASLRSQALMWLAGKILREGLALAAVSAFVVFMCLLAWGLQ